MNRRKKMRRGKLKMHTQFWFEKTNRRDHLGEFRVDVVVNCFGCMELKGRVILNGELKRIYKKTGITHFKVLSKYLP
jgi:hypothetical protein